MRITSPTDAVLGALLSALGAAGVFLCSWLPMGTAHRMGPGYFPTLVSWVLIGFGVVLLARSVVIRGPRIEEGRLRPFLLVLAAVAAFAFGVERLGLLATIIVMVPVAALACRESHPIEAGGAAVVLGVFSCVLFIALLGLPMSWLPPGLEWTAPTQVPTNGTAASAPRPLQVPK